ncbi:lysophospholipid acyltransferase family protein [Allobranchiibius sp. GilTou73]|uniref:lysophospholipid acyltransferase family protein n=1 Tax=unclassified Allobranchiibius TaxID=2649857 RepID=UPI001AA0E356|nr:lysophospholipid acyltransferase family protein [Allobranchiibius sp. GilTou73]MBO1766342.1 1-acyl-sn-glycerol-3-phosphate acyltransferase [Allobranchiibius sp. GilTou38]UIJ34059.1 1-acyl-sn-glycerol-3-phosphate acyltransferase [Allobranchiibius sp. GilTou73]
MTELRAAPLANAGRLFGAALVRVVYSASAVHAGRMPRTGSVIVVSNHTGFLDGPVIFCLSPRTVRFLVKHTYFTSAWGAVLSRTGQIPIRQNTGDRVALAAAKDLLGQGGALGVFPEGTRGSGSVRDAQQGAAWLALQSGAPVIPVATLGTWRAGGTKDSWPLPRARVRVVFGEPFHVETDPDVTGRERLRLATALIRERLATHVLESLAETGMTLPVGERDAA